MPRESKRAKRERAIEVCRRMGELYPQVESALWFRNPYELVISVLLSAQTTDAAVNKVTPELFRRWPDPEALAAADVAEVGEVIRTIGFWRAKAEHKTANIVLNKAYGVVDGIAVDTHVFRISRRLRFSDAPTPLACEQDLLALLPHELWGPVNEQWIHFGRDTCTAHAPACDGCPLMDLCPSCGKAEGNPEKKKR